MGIENYLGKTAKKIALKKNPSYGLLQGSTGEAIMLFLSNEKLNSDFKDNALNKLNSLSDSIATIEDLRFENGLSGIGWGIEWIAQNGYLEMNTDEILEDLDNLIYQSIVYGEESDESLAKGSLGKLLYFLNRYRSLNPQVNRLKNIFHEECLILLTDDIFEKLIGEGGTLSKPRLEKQDMINLGHIAYYLSDFLNENVNTPTVEKTLYKTIKFVDTYISKSISDEAQDDNSYKMFLCGCYFLAGYRHGQNYWQNRAKGFLKKMSEPKITFKTPSLIATNILFYESILKPLPYQNTPEFDNNITISSYMGKQFIWNLIDNKTNLDFQNKYWDLLVMI